MSCGAWHSLWLCVYAEGRSWARFQLDGNADAFASRRDRSAARERVNSRIPLAALAPVKRCSR